MMSNANAEHDRPDQGSDAEGSDALDRATVSRLAKLRTMPVELSRLEAAVASHIPRPQTGEPRVAGRRTWFRPLRAVAAGIALLAALTIAFLTWPSGAALASPPRMAALHARLVAGEIPVTEVASVEAANKVLASQSPQSPRMPDLPHDHVMACCLNEVDDRVVACLLLKHQGKPVSMMVADAKQLRSPASGGEAIERGGASYRVHASGKINMVMSARQGRWVCVMGELPAEELLGLASKLKY
jgi:hypothetical protein